MLLHNLPKRVKTYFSSLDFPGSVFVWWPPLKWRYSRLSIKQKAPGSLFPSLSGWMTGGRWKHAGELDLLTAVLNAARVSMTICCRDGKTKRFSTNKDWLQSAQQNSSSSGVFSQVCVCVCVWAQDVTCQPGRRKWPDERFLPRADLRPAWEQRGIKVGRNSSMWLTTLTEAWRGLTASKSNTHTHTHTHTHTRAHE